MSLTVLSGVTGTCVHSFAASDVDRVADPFR
jgi:hypothetical protein